MFLDQPEHLSCCVLCLRNEDGIHVVKTQLMNNRCPLNPPSVHGVTKQASPYGHHGAASLLLWFPYHQDMAHSRLVLFSLISVLLMSLI